MAPASSTIDRLFARLEAAAAGRGGDELFRRARVPGMGRIVVGPGVATLAERLGARAFTTDRGTIAMPELRPDDPENLALLFHEHLHAVEGRPDGGEAEERAAQAREAMVFHLAANEGVTEVGAILERLETERDAWQAASRDQPGGTGGEVRASRVEPHPLDVPEPRRGGSGSPEEAVATLLDAGYDLHAIVEALLQRVERVQREARRERSFRFAGRTVL